MTRKLPKGLTRNQRALIKAPRGGTRAVTKAEKLAHPSRFSKGGEYLVRAGAKVTKRTPYVTRTRMTDWLRGVSHGKASRQRATGELPYKTAASAKQAAKARVTFGLRRAAKTVERVERPPGARDRSRYYRPNQGARDNFVRLRAKKLWGIYLAEGDWHQMIDIAKAINDPMLSALMKSA